MKNLVECIPVLELLCPKYRLCMVRVKPFPKRKMFSCVWLHFKKFSGKYFLMFGKEEGKDKPKKNIINDRNPRSRSRQRDLAKARSRSTLREIAPSITIFAAIIGLELARSMPPGARSPPAIIGLTGMFLLFSRVRALSLSLSLFPEMLWSENEGRKSFPGQRWKYWSTGSHFLENIIFRDSQTCGFWRKWFPEVIFTQNKHSHIYIKKLSHT